MDMEGSSSFQRPTVDGFVPFHYPSWPSWVLLDKRVHFAHHENARAKKVKMSIDQEVQISFCLFDPAAADISHCCVHSPQIPSEDTFEARVVSSAENLVLLCFAFRTGPRSTAVNPDLVEFFVCTAGSGGNLSIEPVPYSPTGTRHSWHAAIVPRGSSDFLVADLAPRDDPGHYDLHVYSSETSKWTTTYLQLPTPADASPRNLPSLPDKVISLGGSVVGWVDLWRGIVFCDVLEKEPVLSFIPLPTTAFDMHRTGQAHKVRDVTCCNGFISFVEIELYFAELNIKSFKMTQDLDTEYFIPVKACHTRDLDNKPELLPNGWKIRTMFRKISWDYWKKRHTVHVDDISAEHSVLLPHKLNSRSIKYALRRLKDVGSPFFGLYGDNVVYLISKVDFWILGVDLEKKKLEISQPYFTESSSHQTVLPCAFPEHMNATPRPNAELVAASFSQKCLLNNHPPLSGTIPVASSPQNGSGYGPQSGYGNYQQPTPLQPEYVLPPNLPPMVQPMPSLTKSGYIYAQWTVLDSDGGTLISVPLDDMNKPVAAPLVLSIPPVPWPNSWLQNQHLQVKNSHHDLDAQKDFHLADKAMN